jgi:hypothetical protein
MADAAAGREIGLGARLVYKIVKNESARKDPPEIYGWRTYALACSACFGGMLFGFDIGTIGGVLTLDPFKKWVSCSSGIADCHADIGD